MCDLCGVLVPEEEAYLYTVADSSATACGALEHGERLLTACSWDHLETLVTAYEQRPFDMEELWASILLEAHHRLGPASTQHILQATGLTLHQLDRARDWHLRRLLQHPGQEQNAAAKAITHGTTKKTKTTAVTDTTTTTVAATAALPDPAMSLDAHGPPRASRPDSRSPADRSSIPSASRNSRRSSAPRACTATTPRARARIHSSTCAPTGSTRTASDAGSRFPRTTAATSFRVTCRTSPRTSRPNRYTRGRRPSRARTGHRVYPTACHIRACT
ncbi:hypothetical protein ACFQ1I_40895 [Kitasatospora arboriphila]